MLRRQDRTVLAHKSPTERGLVIFFWGPPVCHISHALLSRRPDPAEAGDYRHLIINTFFYLFTFVLEKYYFVVNPDVRTLIKATKINLDEALGWLSRNIQGLDPADTCN